MCPYVPIYVSLHEAGAAHDYRALPFAVPRVYVTRTSVCLYDTPIPIHTFYTHTYTHTCGSYCVYIYICVNGCMCVYMCVCMCVDMYVHMSLYYVFTSQEQVCVYVYGIVYMYLHVWMYVCVHVCVYVCACVCMCMYTCRRATCSRRRIRCVFMYVIQYPHIRERERYIYTHI